MVNVIELSLLSTPAYYRIMRGFSTPTTVPMLSVEMGVAASWQAMSFKVL
jgi:hypothetical protein